MKAQRFRLTSAAAVAALLAIFAGAGPARADGTAVVLDLEGALGVATAEYIVSGIRRANDENARVVIIRMDTPGGLVEPMRDIVQAILASKVPVVTYVSPAGARAASAGTYILLASHVAAMAPTTHLGAATPVSMIGGNDFSPGDQPAKDDEKPADDSDAGKEPAGNGESGDSTEDKTTAPAVPDTAMERKVLNDAVSYIRSLAEAHGRNADWAEDAVRNAATLTATEALDRNVIDLMANDLNDLLQKIDGREVQVANAPFTIDTTDIAVDELEPSWRLKVLNAIASPEIAVLLLMVGLYGLLFEGYNPGAVLPGVAGVICLLLAAYALQVLPVNYAGLALLIVGIALIVAEAFVPSFGALGLGGIAAIIIGLIMMFDSGIPGFGISISFVVTLALAAGLFLLWLLSYLVRLRRKHSVIGRESIVGGVGTATQAFTGDGRIWLESESWNARSASPVAKDQKVRVLGMSGLVLDVEPIPDKPATGGPDSSSARDEETS